MINDQQEVLGPFTLMVSPLYWSATLLLKWSKERSDVLTLVLQYSGITVIDDGVLLIIIIILFYSIYRSKIIKEKKQQPSTIYTRLELILRICTKYIHGTHRT